MTTRSIVIVALMLVLGAARAEDAGHGAAAGSPGAGAALARAEVARRFLDGFWVTLPAEAPVPAAPAAGNDDPTPTRAPVPLLAAPAWQLFLAPASRRWLLPRWSWHAAAAMLVIAAGIGLAGVLRGCWLELHDPRRLRQQTAVKALRAWRNAPPAADLLQAFREFYGLPPGCDADAVAAVVGKTDADLAQAILAIDRQRFAAPCAVSAEACNAHPVHQACEPLARWLKHPPQRLPGGEVVVLAGVLAAAAGLFLAAGIVVARDAARPDGLTPLWSRALQVAAEDNYACAFDAFLAIARVSPSSPELSRNLAVLAAAAGRPEQAIAWRQHALTQEQLRGTVRLAGKKWRGVVGAQLLAAGLIGAGVAAMGWPVARRRALAWRAWLSLPAALFACCALFFVGHWQQCRFLQRRGVVATAQVLLATPSEEAAADLAAAAAGLAIAPSLPAGPATEVALSSLAAGDFVTVQQQRHDWCYVSAAGAAGWLPRSQILPFKL